jgi:hypothetical protein
MPTVTLIRVRAIAPIVRGEFPPRIPLVFANRTSSQSITVECDSVDRTCDQEINLALAERSSIERTNSKRCHIVGGRSVRLRGTCRLTNRKRLNTVTYNPASSTCLFRIPATNRPHPHPRLSLRAHARKVDALASTANQSLELLFVRGQATSEAQVACRALLHRHPPRMPRA